MISTKKKLRSDNPTGSLIIYGHFISMVSFILIISHCKSLGQQSTTYWWLEPPQKGGFFAFDLSHVSLSTKQFSITCMLLLIALHLISPSDDKMYQRSVSKFE
jgi:hypothetical protein